MDPTLISRRLWSWQKRSERISVSNGYDMADIAQGSSRSSAVIIPAVRGGGEGVQEKEAKTPDASREVRIRCCFTRFSQPDD